jgi:hypothetical protein
LHVLSEQCCLGLIVRVCPQQCVSDTFVVFVYVADRARLCHLLACCSARCAWGDLVVGSACCLRNYIAVVFSASTDQATFRCTTPWLALPPSRTASSNVSNCDLHLHSGLNGDAGDLLHHIRWALQVDEALVDPVEQEVMQSGCGKGHQQHAIPLSLHSSCDGGQSKHAL